MIITVAHLALEAQLPTYWVPVLNTLYSFILCVTQGPTIWVPGLLGSSLYCFLSQTSSEQQASVHRNLLAHLPLLCELILHSRGNLPKTYILNPKPHIPKPSMYIDMYIYTSHMCLRTARCTELGLSCSESSSSLFFRALFRGPDYPIENLGCCEGT